MSKKKRKQDKIALLSKDKLNTIEVITSNDLTDSYIKHHEFFSVSNMLKEYDALKEAVKIL